MQHDNISITGKVHLILLDNKYNVKQNIIVPNLVVSTGLELIAARLAGIEVNNTLISRPTHLAIGSSKTAATIKNTALLGTEYFRKSLDTPTVFSDSKNVINFAVQFGVNEPTEAVVIQEAGLFNSNTDGIMLARTVFDSINKGISDLLIINWMITIN